MIKGTGKWEGFQGGGTWKQKEIVEGNRGGLLTPAHSRVGKMILSGRLQKGQK